MLTARRSLRPRAGIVLHRVHVLTDEERDERAGIPVTSLSRTLIDIAAGHPDRLERIVEEADRLRLLTTAEVESLCADHFGRPGASRLAAAVGSLSVPVTTRSALEDLFRRLCARHRLDPPEFNVVISGLEVDAVWRERRLVVELDGRSYHAHRAAFERDRLRDTQLQIAGYRVIRITFARLTTEPLAVMTELRALLASGLRSA